MRLFHYQLSIAVLFMCLTAHKACTADYSSEKDYLQEFPIILSASRLSQPLSEAPNAMTVITREMIVASGFRKIPDLFKLVPGMYVSYYKGSQAIVSFHGTTDQYSRRMQVLIDGRSVYLPPNNTVDWAYLPITINDIERIEVIRGPAAASYGANSTQGVINIITRDAGETDTKRFAITRGTKGINDVLASFDRHSDVFDYRATLAYTADNGYDNLSTPPDSVPSNSTSLLNNSYDSNQARLVNYHGNYRPNMIDSFDMQFGFNHDVQEVGFIDKNPSPANPNSTNGDPPHNLYANSSFVQFGWKRLLDNFSELNLRYFHIQENQHEDLPVYLNGIYFPGPVVQRLDVSRDELDVQHIKQLYESNRLVYGANYQRNQVNGQSIMPPISLSLSSAQVIENFQVFANDEWRLNKRMLLNVGAMLERDNNGYQNTSPRASLNFHLTPEHTLRTSISVAYRNPAITETNKPAIQPGVLFIPSAEATSPDLVPEKMISREIGYLGNFRDEMAMLDIRLFSDSLSNGIVPSSGVLVNGLSADYQGFEGTLKKKWADTSDLTVNFSHIFATSNTMALAAAGNTYFDSSYDMLSASIPKNSASLLYSLRLASNYSFSASYYYQDSSQPFDRGPIDFQPVQHRTDIRIARNFHVDNKMNGNVALVIQNLFNTDYTEYISSNEFHRCGYITLTIDF